MSLLIQGDNTLLVGTKLAMTVGLNEAMVLQQVHYWLMRSKHTIAGRKWVYNSYREWNKQFPFWSYSVVKRTFRSLEEQGYLLSDSFNKRRMDKTKWYSVNYKKLEQLEKELLNMEKTNETYRSLESSYRMERM